MHTTPIIVISGAIGSGKGTIIHALVNELPLTWVPTHTTRPMRRDDTVLGQRIFDTDATFERYRERNAFIESAEIGDYQYGLVRDDLETVMKTGQAAIVELSVAGGLALEKIYPNVLLIFVTAPENSRRERIAHRHMDAGEMKLRMSESAEEEKQAHAHYDFIVENPDHRPDLAIRDIYELIEEHFPQLTVT